VFGGESRALRPPEYPHLGFAFHSTEAQAVNVGLSWLTWDERFALVLEVLKVWDQAGSDEQQKQELIWLFGDAVVPLIGTELVLTRRLRPEKRQIQCWCLHRASSIGPPQAHNLFKIKCLDYATMVSVSIALESLTPHRVLDRVYVKRPK
jgi:hypothetical protein